VASPSRRVASRTDRHSPADFLSAFHSAVAAAAAKAFYDLYKEGSIPADMVAPFVVGMLVSALTGCIVIAFFLRYLRTHDLRFFVYYRIVFGVFILVLALFVRP
jgi:undecaprenyl-diphosphatase